MIEQLYRKKLIRDYLSLFPEPKWKSLISHTLEFAILTLKSKHKLYALTLEDLINAVNAMKRINSPPKRNFSKQKRSVTPQKKSLKFNKKPKQVLVKQNLSRQKPRKASKSSYNTSVSKPAKHKKMLNSFSEARKSVSKVKKRKKTVSKAKNNLTYSQLDPQIKSLECDEELNTSKTKEYGKIYGSY